MALSTPIRSIRPPGRRASEFRSDLLPPGISSAVATGSAASVNVPAMAHPPLQEVTSSPGGLVAPSCVVVVLSLAARWLTAAF
jgi:hypothetical protein